MSSPFSIYLPIDRRLALARGQSLPDRAEGAVLFADIDGFTPLAAVLAEQLGPQRGAEQLTRELNRIYGTAIATVHQYDGSVVSFSGDAITCWFAASSHQPGDLRGCLRQALTSALALVRTVGEIEAISTPGGAIIPVSMKVAVTAGPIRRFQAGNAKYGIFEALAGATIDRLERILRQTRQGEVAIDAETAALHGDHITVSERPAMAGTLQIQVVENLRTPAHPAAWPEESELPEEIVRDWLLTPVFERLQRGAGEFLAELRPAVALFVGFSGLDYDGDDEAGEKLNAFVCWAQSVLARYEGFMIGLNFGDKGSYLHATFGAIVAHEDDSARAVSAALQLLEPPPELDFIRDVKVGISQGLMRTGAFGGPTRRTYGIQGVQVNVAARMMDRAKPGSILVTEPVARYARSVTDFKKLGPRAYKGLNVPILTFEIGSKRQRRPVRSPYAGPRAPVSGVSYSDEIIGREDERAEFREQLSALKGGESSNALIIGEAGIGKTRLMAEFVNQSTGRDIRTLIGAGSPIEQTTPYFAWRPIFRALLNVDEADSIEVVREAVTSHLADEPHFLERAPLLNAILPLNLPDNELTAGMRGEVRLNNTGALLVHMLWMGKLASTPLVLVLEDAHWLDSASWALADRARREIDTILLMIVTRPMPENRQETPLPTAYLNLLEQPETHYYVLGSLPSDDALALVCRRLSVRSLPPDVGALIRERTEGHPFFSEEIALALRDAGIIRVENGQAILAEGADLRALDFPDTIQGVITSRIDRLRPGQDLALKVASVIGRIFFFRTLEAIYPVAADRPHLASHLDALARLDITPLESREPELTYLFRHALTQEVVYNLLLFQQRQELHGAVAGWYEQNYASDLTPFYPLLAYHWGQASVRNKTLDYLERAASQALRNFANREVVGFLNQALTLVAQPPAAGDFGLVSAGRLRLLRWYRQLGEAQLGLGRLTESRASMVKALSLTSRSAPESGRRVALSLGGQLLRQAAHRLLPGLFLARASAEQAEIMLEAVRAYQQLAEIHYYANERALTLNAGLNVLNLCERIGPSPDLARAYANMAVIAGLIRWHGAAESYSHRALQTAEQFTDASAQAWVNLLVGTYYVGIGRWQQCAEHAVRAIDISRELGDHRLWGLSLGLLALVPAAAGDFATSRAHYADWYEVALGSDNIQHQSFGLFGQAENDLPLDQAQDAAAFADQGLTLLIEKAESSFETRTAEIRGYGLLALAHLRMGESSKALEAANQALDTVNQLSAPTRVTLFEGLSGMTEVYLHLWESGHPQATSSTVGSIQAGAKRACQVLEKYARVFPIGLPRALLMEGWRFWLDGRPDRARKAWQSGLDAAVQLQMPYERALLHFEIGRRTTGPESENHLAQARKTFSALGATHHLRLLNTPGQ